MAQGNRYSSYRGRKSPGELLLAVLLILIIVAAVGFMLLQRYMVYDEDGNLRLELPDWGGKPSSGQPPVSSEDLNIIIDRKEPEEPDTPTMPEVPVEPEVIRGSRGFWLADTPLEDWDAALERLPEDISGVCLTVKDTEGMVYVDSAAAARLSRRVLSLKKTTGQAVGDLTDAEGVDAIARIVCLLDPRVPILDVRALGLRQKTGYLFYDDTGASWLDPTKTSVQNYLAGLAHDCADMGFDEILLAYVSYPAGGELEKINYGEQPKGENLARFIETVRTALEGTDVRLSLELPAEVIRTGSDDVTGQELRLLAPLVDRIYAESVAEEATELAELVKAAAPDTDFAAIVTGGVDISVDCLVKATP